MPHFLLAMMGAVAIGSWLFWPLLVIPFLILIFLVENEKSYAAGFFSVAALVILGFLLDQTIAQYVFRHPVTVIGGYIVAGVAWGILKWWFFLHKKRRWYEKLRSDFFLQNKVGSITPANKPDFERFLTSKGTRLRDFEPEAQQARRNKGRIIFWMSYWPVSMVGWIVNDPITRFYKFLFRMLTSVFDNMAKAVFKKYAADFTQ